MILWAIVDAYRYSSNNDIHRDRRVTLVREVIEDFASIHEQHVNMEAVKLLDISHNIRRLKHHPHDLVAKK